MCYFNRKLEEKNVNSMIKKVVNTVSAPDNSFSTGVEPKTDFRLLLKYSILLTVEEL